MSDKNKSTIATVDDLQISQLPPKPTGVVGGDQLAIDEAITNITYGITVADIIADAVNPSAQLGGTGQVTGLPAALANLQAQITALSPVVSHEVYVRPEGSDLTGDGTASNPYATLSYALSTIMDATFDNPYLINAYGHFTDTDWAIKPNISYDFNGGIYDVTNQITLAPSIWDGITSNVVIANAFNCAWASGMNLDFQSANSTTSFFTLKNIKINTSSDIDVIGNPTSYCFVFIENFDATQDIPSVLIQDCYVVIENLFAYQFTLNHTAISLDSYSYITDLDTIYQTDFNNNTPDPLNLYLTNCRLNNTAFSSSDGGIFTINSIGTFYNNGLTLDSDDPDTLLFRPDILSIMPVLLGSAVFSPVSIADSINANITPVGYSIAGPAVSQHLTGIGNELVAISSNVLTWEEVLTTPQSMAPQTGYVINSASLVTLTLPTTASFGSEMRVIAKGAGGFTITQNAGQSIRLGALATTIGPGGSLSSMIDSDALILTCTTSDTVWTAYGVQNNFTIT